MKFNQGIFISKQIEDKPFSRTVLSVLPEPFESFEEYEKHIIQKLKDNQMVVEMDGMTHPYEIKVNLPTVEIKIFTGEIINQQENG